MTVRAWVFAFTLSGGVAALLLSQFGILWALAGLLGVAVLGGVLTRSWAAQVQGQAARFAAGERIGPAVAVPVRELADVSASLLEADVREATAQSAAVETQLELQTLLDAMSEGVLELDEHARLVRANQAARRILELREPKVQTPIEDLVRGSTLRAAIDDALAVAPDPVEVTPWDRTLLVRAKVSTGKGAIVTVQDLTEVRRLERVRTDFVANASHELKTPLTALRGFAETLLDEEPPPEVRRNFVASIARNALRLQRLVEDLLDLSRLESGGWRLEPAHVDLAALARRTWSDTVGDREGEVTLHVVGEGTAWADAGAVEQIFANLFSNALRYTDAGGSVTVRLRSGKERLQTAVIDTGSGIPADHLPRIFERFYRVDPARSREDGGTGLGLSIVSHLVRTMGGSVGATSAAGEGTTITFTLPLEPTSGDSDVGGEDQALP